jgi:aryl-alcohol dehydrogenase-like predicted oxidoreductase
MQRTGSELSRRAFLASAAVGVAAGVGPRGAAAPAPILTRPIPATGEPVPAIGMGTWITFNVGDDPALRDRRLEVLAAFFALGGTVIDSSPMYGSSEAVIGHGLKRLANRPALFAATKVWTPLVWRGPGQMEESRALWGVERFDLMQVHNLLRWEGHLETLLEDKAQGRIRYVGLTTSHGRRHDALEAAMRSRPLDAVQLTYNILDREAEQRLLPLAAERGLAVIVNRPFRQGELLQELAGRPLPGWAGEIGCASWAQFLLKFVLSHPAVTCVIPATSRVDHMRENMAALRGPLPDPATRARMVRHLESV